MANTLNLGNGNWATKKDSLLAYNSENGNFKPLPFSFSRASNATVVNEQGFIDLVGSDEPRIDFKDYAKGSLLLEPTRSNLITYSEDIESWSTTGVITKENNVSISPDGTLNAGTITSNASNFDRITQTISVSANSTYTGSLFIKKVQSQTNYMGIGFIFTGGTTDVGYVIFDAVNGIAVSADARIDVISEVKDFGDYWRLQSTATDNGSNTSLQFNIYATLSTNGTTTGLGISSPRTIWGIQLEQGSYATSYIPTSGQANGVTRVADSCIKNNIDTSIINSSYPFTIYVESTVIASNLYVVSFLNDSSSSQSYSLALSSNQVYFGARANGITENLFSGVTLTNGQTFKVAVTMESATSGKLAVNGIVISKTNFISQAANVNINDLLLGQLRTISDTGDRLPIKDVKLYNTALTDQELIALTS